MSHRYTILGFCAGAAALVSAQPTLTSLNVPSPGQQFPVLKCESFLNPGPAGAAVDYDYWGMLEPNTSNKTYHWAAASSTPTGALIPSATLISSDGGSDTLFWAVTAQGLEQVGSRASDEGNTPLQYTDAILELKLPCAFGTTWTDATAASVTTPFGPATRTGTIQGHADGYGALRMPEGTVIDDVLRVKVRRDFSDQTLFGTINRIRNSYYFYAAASVYPYLKLQVDSTQAAGNPNWAVTRLAEWQGNGFTVGVDDFESLSVAFTAYPNPVSGAVSVLLSVPSSAEAQIIDATGRAVRRLRFTADRFSMDLSGLAAGAYSLRILDAAGRSLGTQRLIVE